MKLLRITNLFALLLLGAGLSYAQKGVEDGSKYGHGEDSIRCIRNLSLSHEYAKNDNFKDAVQWWRIVFDECPKASKNIYIDGAKIYKALIESSEDIARQSQMIDTLMLVYDRRIQNYNQEGDVLGRKGVDLLRYRRDDPAYIKEAYGYLGRSIDLEGKSASYAVLATYMTSSIALFKSDEVSAEQVVSDYVKVSKILDELLVKKPGNSTLMRLKADIDEGFASSGAADCNVLEEIFTKKYDENQSDVAVLENILEVLKANNCTESGLFFNASASLHQLKPSSLSASSLAAMSIAKGEFKPAYDYLKQAIELETSDDKKADYYYTLAYVTSKLSNYPEARTFALKAAELRPNWGDPYILIGNLYAGSSDLCSSLSLKNAIYWVAVDKFIKAKSIDPSVADQANKLISTYASYYPNKEEAFFLGINEGSSFKVECWINETTTVRF